MEETQLEKNSSFERGSVENLCANERKTPQAVQSVLGSPSGVQYHPLNGPPSDSNQFAPKTTYASTKNVSQGFMNISLLSANACQLKLVLKAGPESDFYQMLLYMITSSIALQIIVGLILVSKYMVEVDGLTEGEKATALRLNSLATSLVTLITALNVIVSTFIGS